MLGSVLVILTIVLVTVVAVVHDRRARHGRTVASPPLRDTRPGRHPAYDLVVGSTADAVVRRLGQPVGGAAVGRGRVEYWLYKNSPTGHDIQIVIDRRGLVQSLEVVPHPGNSRGVARHVISPPNRQQPMAARWRNDRDAVLSDPEATVRALAEFAETFEIEEVEHGLTAEQKRRRVDRPALDTALEDESAEPTWMRTPLAIRRIGHELDHRGGFRTMQDTYYRARELAGGPGGGTVVELLWDRIGSWER